MGKAEIGVDKKRSKKKKINSRKLIKTVKSTPPVSKQNINNADLVVQGGVKIFTKPYDIKIGENQKYV